LQSYQEGPSEERFDYLVNALLRYYKVDPTGLSAAERRCEADIVRDTLAPAL